MITRFTSKTTLKKGGETMKKLGLALAVLALCSGVASADTASYDVYAGWNLVAAPLVPITSDPLSVFSSVNIVGTLSKYDAPTQGGVTYDDLDPAMFGNVLLGEGYWLLCDANNTISYQGVADGVPDANLVKTDMWVSLPGNTLDGVDEGGWHLIGHTFNHDTPVTVTNPGDNIFITDGTQMLTWQQAADLGWCEAVMTGYDGIGQGGFAVGYDLADDDSLRAGKGYWFLTKKDNLAMIIPGN